LGSILLHLFLGEAVSYLFNLARMVRDFVVGKAIIFLSNLGTVFFDLVLGEVIIFISSLGTVVRDPELPVFMVSAKVQFQSVNVGLS
jgi:hypothetical protein